MLALQACAALAAVAGMIIDAHPIIDSKDP